MPRNDQFQTPQARQADQWMNEVTGLLQKLGAKFSDLQESTKRELIGHASDIAKLNDSFADVQRKYGQRFRALADHYAGGGGYIGPFEDANEAAQFGRIVAAIAGGDKSGLQRADLSPGTGPAGGILIPQSLIGSIIRNVDSHRVVDDVRHVPVATESGSWSRRSAGATVMHPDIAAGPSESALKFDRINFRLTRYSALSIIDRWMLNQALTVALGDYVAMELSYALSSALEKYLLVGDGTPTHARTLGIFNRAGLTDGAPVVVTAASGHDTFAEVVGESTVYLSELLGALPDAAEGMGDADSGDGDILWYLHRTVFWSYLGQRDGNDRPIADIAFAPGRADGKPRKFMFGYEARTSPHAPKLSETAASKVLLAAGNLKKGWALFSLGTGGGYELRVSEHYKFVEGQVAMLLDALLDLVETDNSVYGVLQTAAS